MNQDGKKHIIIYILYFNEETKRLSYELFEKHPLWAVPLELDQTHLLESGMYATQLNNMYEDWKDADYVGTISPRGAKSKIKNLAVLCKAFDTYISDRNQNTFGDIAFFLPFKEKPGWKHSNKKGFLCQSILNSCIQTCNLKTIPGDQLLGYCNFWMAKPTYLKDYIDLFASTFLPKLESQAAVWTDSEYKGNKKYSKQERERLFKIFTKSYYPLHPFICERFINSFAYSKNLERKHWNGKIFV
jgi:hypothetical protein